MSNADDFGNRLRKNARHWGRWARRRGITCYRVYDRDIPEFALALDRYGDRAHLQEYARGTAEAEPARDQRLADLSALVADALDIPVAKVFVKSRRRRRGGEPPGIRSARGRDFVIEEGGHRFLVNLEGHLDTGLFLDHRNTRAMVAAEARGKRVLNLFCYTGSFSVYAAGSGASETLSVDLSNTYLEWAQRNFQLNKLDLQQHRLQRVDVLPWLETDAASYGRFDLIVLDPPTFSSSKAMPRTLDIQRDYPVLLHGCAGLLTPRGVVYFSTNLRTFRFEPALVPALRAEEISHLTVPEDFRNRRIHRCWRVLKC